MIYCRTIITIAIIDVEPYAVLEIVVGAGGGPGVFGTEIGDDLWNNRKLFNVMIILISYNCC